MAVSNKLEEPCSKRGEIVCIFCCGERPATGVLEMLLFRDAARARNDVGVGALVLAGGNGEAVAELLGMVT